MHLEPPRTSGASLGSDEEGAPVPSQEKATTEATTSTLRPHSATMSTLSGKRELDTTKSTFDPGLDIATVVFSHVQCVKTRHSLALVSKVWRDASKTAAACPLRFDFDALSRMPYWTRIDLIIALLDNDEALSLPYERVAGLLGRAETGFSARTTRSTRVIIAHLITALKDNDEALLLPNKCLDFLVKLRGSYATRYAACLGSVRLLNWARENTLAWSTYTCTCAAYNGHLPALKYLHENGCPWSPSTCHWAAQRKHWDCLQYLVDNKCRRWEKFAKKYAEHLR